MNWNVRQKGFAGLLYCRMLGQVLISRISIRLLHAIISPLITFFSNFWIHFSQFIRTRTLQVYDAEIPTSGSFEFISLFFPLCGCKRHLKDRYIILVSLLTPSCFSTTNRLTFFLNCQFFFLQSFFFFITQRQVTDSFERYFDFRKITSTHLLSRIGNGSQRKNLFAEELITLQHFAVHHFIVVDYQISLQHSYSNL